jgi:hypothetical protein
MNLNTFDAIISSFPNAEQTRYYAELASVLYSIKVGLENALAENPFENYYNVTLDIGLERKFLSISFLS